MASSIQTSQEPSFIVETIERQIDDLLKIQKDEVEQGLQEKIDIEKEEAQRKIETIERNFENDKSLLDQYKAILSELRIAREKVVDQIKAHFEQAQKYQNQLKGLSDQANEELQKINSLSSELEDIRKKVDDENERLKKGLKEHFGIDAKLPESFEFGKIPADWNNEVNRMEKIRELLATIGETQDNGEGTAEDLGEFVVEPGPEIKDSGNGNEIPESILQGTDVSQTASEAEVKEAAEEDSDQADESTKDVDYFEFETSSVDAGDNGSEAAVTDSVSEEVAEAIVDDAIKEAVGKAAAEASVVGAEEEAAVGEAEDETETVSIKAAEDTVDDTVEGEVPTAETASQVSAELAAEAEDARGVSYYDDVTGDDDQASIEEPAAEKPEADDNLQTLMETLLRFQKTEPITNGNDFGYFQKESKMILDGEAFLAMITKVTDEAKLLHAQLEEKESIKDVFMLKQDILNEQEILRKLFFRAVTFCEKEEGSLPSYLGSAVTVDSIKDVLERLTIGNWSDVADFESFMKDVAEIKGVIQEKLTPLQDYVKSVLEQLDGQPDNGQ